MYLTIDLKVNFTKECRPVPSILCDICTYFEIATSNSLRGGAFVRDVTEALMAGRITGRFWYDIVLFSDIINSCDSCHSCNIAKGDTLVPAEVMR